MMIRKLLNVWALLSAVTVLQAQDLPWMSIENLVARQDQEVLDRQSDEIAAALDEVGAPYAVSTVAIVAGDRMVASGTVVAPGKVITKYSDLKDLRILLSVVDMHGKVYDRRVLAVAPEYDIVLLDVPGLEAPPVDLSEAVDVDEGNLIFTMGPGGKAADFGVVSVDQRSLREQDMAYLGMEPDHNWRGQGMRVRNVYLHSPAQRVGIRPGDIVKQVNGKDIRGFNSLRIALNHVSPGDKVQLKFKRGGKMQETDIVAGNRPRMPVYPQERLKQMNQMGNRMNSRRGDFPVVYQSDMTLLPERAGTPVIDLNGKWVGMALSRAGRTETYILPAWVVKAFTEQVLAEMSGTNAPLAEPVDEVY